MDSVQIRPLIPFPGGQGYIHSSCEWDPCYREICKDGAVLYYIPKRFSRAAGSELQFNAMFLVLDLSILDKLNISIVYTNCNWRKCSKKTFHSAVRVFPWIKFSLKSVSSLSSTHPAAYLWLTLSCGEDPRCVMGRVCLLHAGFTLYYNSSIIAGTFQWLNYSAYSVLQLIS